MSSSLKYERILFLYWLFSIQAETQKDGKEGREEVDKCSLRLAVLHLSSHSLNSRTFSLLINIFSLFPPSVNCTLRRLLE